MNTPKLSLDLDDLTVDSFATAPESNQMLQQSDYILTVAGPTENVRASCIVGSCNGSCYTCEVNCWM
jgi:hypothetical protein